MDKFWPFLKKHLINNKYLYLIIFILLVFRIINLTAFPLFNDESIYLDWGTREINNPGFLYYSLYDAKQPLLMWAFGIMENLLTDPVFAGRLVSVFAGLLTMLGLYKLTNYLVDKKTALLASMLYIFIPLFSFYDRQALMESAVCAVGVWSCYFLIKCLKEKQYKDFIFLGFVLGIGYFIKSTPLVFLGISLFIIITYLLLNKEKQKYFEGLVIIFLVFLATIFLLIINPQFWETLSTNSRFTLTISELLKFPYQIWVRNIISNSQTIFFYITPVISVLGFLGIYKTLRLKEKFKIIVFAFFISSLIIETLIIRGGIDRYLSAFLPLIIFFASFYLMHLVSWKKTKMLGFILIVAAIITSVPVTLLQVINQANYFIYYGKISGVSFYNYLDSFTTGYGLDQVFAYLDDISKEKKIIVGIAENTGNPESAVIVNYYKNPNVRSVYFDSRLLPPEIMKYDCIDIGVPLYFVSRDNQLVGLDKFLINVKFIKDPYGKNITGIYKLKTNCKGKVATLNLQQN
jgi:4-amino-4-deoxy-L-arabinose transferase-like glycosyltransferase